MDVSALIMELERLGNAGGSNQPAMMIINNSLHTDSTAVTITLDFGILKPQYSVYGKTIQEALLDAWRVVDEQAGVQPRATLYTRSARPHHQRSKRRDMSQ